ncbi:MAG: hypothetical protein JNL74_06265 [Fibrobacteres bacterium]|nr:hypothetical protein [Fibrobacterota bacterium]
MMRYVFFILILSVASFSEETDSSKIKEAMEIGGLVTLDIYGPVKEMDHPSFEIGSVYLGANMTLSPAVTASVVIAAEGNMEALWIDQAIGVLAPEGSSWSLSAGQQTLKHGLLTTRLICDPLILDSVELINPALTADYTKGVFTYGAAFTAIPTLSPDTALINNDRLDWTAVLALDYNNEESILQAARLSSLITDRKQDIDLAVTATLKSFTLDLEAYSVLNSNRPELVSGSFAGLSWQATEKLAIAGRYDMLSPDRFKDADNKVCFGAKFDIRDGIFCAVEFERTWFNSGGNENEINLQLGLENTIKLPGFHRETLTNN